MARPTSVSYLLLGIAVLGAAAAYGPLTGRAPWPGLFHRQPPAPPIRVPLPKKRPVLFVVYFRHGAKAVPTETQIRRVVWRWVDRHTSDKWHGPLQELLMTDRLEVSIGSKQGLPPPSSETLRRAGAGKQELRRLQAATHYVALSVTDRPDGSLYRGLWGGIAAARAVAAGFSGVIVDPALEETQPVASHAQRLPADTPLRITDHVSVAYSLEKSGLGWMATEGMSKFGLPELQVEDYPPDLSYDLGTVLFAAGRRLLSELEARPEEHRRARGGLRIPSELRLDRRALVEPGEPVPALPAREGRGWTTVRLRYDPGGPNEVPVLTLLPPRSSRAEHGVWLNSLCTDLFGNQSTFRRIDPDSPAMIAARERAAAELPRVKKRFLAGLRAGELLYVKTGVDTQSGDREYMWVVVNTWKGYLLTGQLSNDPRWSQKLRAGQTVHLYDSDVVDWMLDLPDGRTEGNYTGAVKDEDAAAAP
jgi:uncharacterized protein YegJ (DUF2314 family)